MNGVSMVKYSEVERSMYDGQMPRLYVVCSCAHFCFCVWMTLASARFLYSYISTNASFDDCPVHNLM